MPVPTWSATRHGSLPTRRVRAYATGQVVRLPDAAAKQLLANMVNGCIFGHPARWRGTRLRCWRAAYAAHRTAGLLDANDLAPWSTRDGRYSGRHEVIITVAAYKGGVGKTTAAIHIAAYLAEKGSTVLIDGDPNRSATGWARRGREGASAASGPSSTHPSSHAPGQGLSQLPFAVMDERQTARAARDFEHLVIDTEARPAEDDLSALATGCDLLVVPTTPDSLALDALGQTLQALEQLKARNFKVLLSIVPPKPSRDGEDARAMLEEQGIPLFGTMIRRYTAYRTAALQGVAVQHVRDRQAKAAWNDFRSVGEEIL